MKTKLAALVLLAGISVLNTGCFSSTAHSGAERWRKLSYNMSLDGAQLQDDIDHQIFMLRDGVTLSLWNVQYQ